MNWGKVGASLVICGVLSAQLYALTPWGRGGWYWPFTDYPMYSEPKYAGSTFGIFDLEAVACDGTVREVTSLDVHLPTFRFRNRLEVAAGGRPDRPREPEEIPAARAFLSRLLTAQLEGEWCHARVHGRIYVMEEHGLASADVPRQLLAEWPIGGGGAP